MRSQLDEILETALSQSWPPSSAAGTVLRLTRSDADISSAGSIACRLSAWRRPSYRVIRAPADRKSLPCLVLCDARGAWRLGGQPVWSPGPALSTLDYESDFADLGEPSQRIRNGHQKLHRVELLYRRCRIPLPMIFLRFNDSSLTPASGFS